MRKKMKCTCSDRFVSALIYTTFIISLWGFVGASFYWASENDWFMALLGVFLGAGILEAYVRMRNNHRKQ